MKGCSANIANSNTMKAAADMMSGIEVNRVKKSALWFREPNLRFLMVPEYFLKERKNLQLIKS